MLMTIVALAGCGADDKLPTQDDGPADAGSTGNPDFFIARQIDFKNFREWPMYKVHTEVDGGTEMQDENGDAPDAGVDTSDAGFDTDGGSFDAGQVAHPVGDRYAYINKLPPSGSEKFPTGTIIVKTTIGLDGVEDKHIHAMVKRNGGFNSKGAVGWEWMELVPAADGSLVILWRDSSPPDGSGYFDPGTLGPQGDCNACHAMSRDNDFVQSVPLQLKNF
jgi:hypothetical protein